MSEKPTSDRTLLVGGLNRYVRDQPSSLRRPQEILLLLTILITGLCLRVYSIDGPSLWLDEAFTWYVAKLPVSDLLSLKADIHPPLYFLLEKPFMQVFPGEFGLRIASAGFGTLAIFVAYLTGKRFVGATCGIVAAAVLATSSTHVEYSQEARNYSLLFLELAFATYGLLGFIDCHLKAQSTTFRGAAKWIVLYFFATLAALYTHNISVYWILAFGLTVLLLWRPFRQIGTGAVVHWCWLNVLLMLLWLPWLASVSTSMGTLSWLDQYGAGKAFATFLGVQGFGHLKGMKFLLNFLVFGCALIGIAAALSTARLSLALAVLSTLVVAPLCVWVTGFVKPVFMTRTIIFAAFGSALGIGIAAALLRRRSVALTFVAVMVLINCVSLYVYYKNDKKQDWRAMARYMTESSQGDPVIFCADYMYMPFMYYYHAGALGAYGWGADRTISSVELSGKIGYLTYGPASQIGKLRRSSDKIWVVLAHCPKTYQQSMADQLSMGEWHETRRKEFNGVTLLLYEAP